MKFTPLPSAHSLPIIFYMSFVFYDLETTGISPAFDQPLQFAAIRTDENFAICDQVNIRCRLAPHILPSPQALAITRLSCEQLTEPALPSLLEFAQRIATLTEQWAPAIWMGYNTINFDEEVLRQTFYQNLLPNIYNTQFNGNTRFDILSAVYATYVRDPDLLIWPTDGTGKQIFKLDQLAPANGFQTHNAHDALGDVEATIHIARQIAARNPDLWTALLENAHKRHVQAKLESFRPLELTMRFSADAPRPCIGCFCGYSQGNNRQAAFFDLEAADPAEWIDASDQMIFTALNEQQKVIHSVSTNKAPALLELRKPRAEHLRRAAVIAEAPAFQQRVSAALAARFVEDPQDSAKPIEKQIYQNFYTDADKQLLEEFQHADWPRRQEITASFSDLRLRQLGRRLVGFYSPQLLSDREAERFYDYLHKKWTAADERETQWMTFAKAEAEIDELRTQAIVEPEALDAIAQFIKDWGARATNKTSQIL